MKRNLVLIVLFFVVCMVSEAKISTKVEKKKSPVCLTVQAENGSIKQKLNEDGTITCVFKSSDLIRVATIILNGEDMTNLLDKNQLNLPLLTKDSTLEIQFDEIPVFNQPTYRTIAMF